MSPVSSGDSVRAEENKSQDRTRWLLGCPLSAAWGILILWSIVIVAVVGSCVLPFGGCVKGRHSNFVVVYTSQDQVYAEPILNEFTRQTGIKVRAVYDSEAVKTVGLANRLLAERARPQCDIFWNNEELRTRQLAAQNTFRETNAWVAVGYRSRRIV